MKLSSIGLASLALTMAIGFGVAAPANAGLHFVGSWEVDQGPYWGSAPPAYSGQGAAALLFGGAASNYVISTVDSNPADVNDMAWVSTFGGACGGVQPCGTQVAQNFVQSTGGLYENGGDTSAYVQDWAYGSQYTNYAFVSVPEPATWAMLILGVAMIGIAARRRNEGLTVAA